MKKITPVFAFLLIFTFVSPTFAQNDVLGYEKPAKWKIGLLVADAICWLSAGGNLVYATLDRTASGDLTALRTRIFGSAARTPTSKLTWLKYSGASAALGTAITAYLVYSIWWPEQKSLRNAYVDPKELREQGLRMKVASRLVEDAVAQGVDPLLREADYFVESQIYHEMAHNSFAAAEFENKAEVLQTLEATLSQLELSMSHTAELVAALQEDEYSTLAFGDEAFLQSVDLDETHNNVTEQVLAAEALLPYNESL